MIPRLLIAAIFVPAVLNAHIQRVTSAQDIAGGAAGIFGRPDDPEVRRMPSRAGTSESQRSKDNKAKPSDPTTSNSSADAVEDALELANSARNSNPPRYRDAEIAYRLAAKLRPKDPRPIIGLGNIWYDQKQYAAAAAMYQQALTILSSAPGVGVTGTMRGQDVSLQRRRNAALLHSYLGTAFVQAENFAAAQTEFDQSIAGDPANARWHALRGYTLMKQGKSVEARKAFQEALRLEPGNADYQKLLESTPVQKP